MLKRPRLVLLIVLVLMVLTLLALPARTASRLKLTISSLFLPLFGLSSAAQGVAEQVGDLALPRNVLLSQLNRLQLENQELRLQAGQMDEIQRENNRFRQYFDFQQRAPWKLKLVRVVGRDPASWWRTVVVDAGSSDGLMPNYSVVTPEGLVGRIERTAIKQSFVALVGDPGCLVAGMVQETRDHGIISPASSAAWDPTAVNLTQLGHSSQVQPGHHVVTSGLGSVFPKGIPIGEVLEVRDVDYGLYTEARVRLSVRLNALEEVYIILP